MPFIILDENWRKNTNTTPYEIYFALNQKNDDIEWIGTFWREQKRKPKNFKTKYLKQEKEIDPNGLWAVWVDGGGD